MANIVTQIVIRARDEASSVFGSMQAKAAAVATAIAGYFGIQLFRDAVGSARAFESAMSAVQAASGATGAELAQLKAAAEEAGASTKFSSVEAANALETLAKSGLNASQAVQALPAVLNLAQAGGVGLAESADYITKAVNGMGLSFDEAGRVADVLAMGANASSTSVEGLAAALSYAAPLASSLGLSIEQTVAILGKFSDAGIDASRAGTALNAILAQFSDPASQFRKELAAAGITTGNFDLALRQLAAAGPEGQRAINAVGTEAGPALRALLNQGIGSLDALKAKLDQSAGSAASFAKVMGDNLDGATKSFGSAWNALLIKLGTPVLDTLKVQINAVSERLRAFVTDGTATAFGNAIRAAFETGGKWVADFVSKIDFTQVAASLQAFATRTGEVFTAIGQHASTASNTVKTAYGVMSAGVNVVLGTIYKLGQAMSWVASAFLADLAKIADGIDSITPDIIADRFGRAADALRLQAQAAYAVFDEFGKRADGAFTAATEGAILAREGFAGLTTTATEATTATAAALQQVETQAGLTADQVAALGDGAVVMGGKVVEAGTQAAAAAGNVQTLGTAANQAAAGVADLEVSAEQVASAFERLGVTSSAELARIAANAKRDFETIRNSGTASTEDIRRAFAVYAERAIEANKGVADYTLKAQAAMYGLRLEADETGQAIVSAMSAGAAETDALANSAANAAQAYAVLGNEIQSLPSPPSAPAPSAGSGAASGGGSFDETWVRLVEQYPYRGNSLVTYQRWLTALQKKYQAAIARQNAQVESLPTPQPETPKGGSRTLGDTGLAPQRISPDLEKALAQPAQATPAAIHTVKIDFGGRSQTINTASQQDATALVSLLQQLETDAMRS